MLIYWNPHWTFSAGNAMSLSHGKLGIFGDDIAYYHAGGASWRIPLAEVRVIGEYTNENGPAGDYFFGFVTQDRWYEASFYAEGAHEFLEELGERLGFELTLYLNNSTTFASRILWPEHLAGRDFLDHSPPTPAKNWIRRCMQRLFPTIESRLTDEVLSEAGWDRSGGGC